LPGKNFFDPPEEAVGLGAPGQKAAPGQPISQRIGAIVAIAHPTFAPRLEHLLHGDAIPP
jgi:hypothetical protein